MKINKTFLIAILTYIFTQTIINCEEYIEIDGINVLKKDYEKAQKEEEEYMSRDIGHLTDIEMENKLEAMESLDVAKSLPKPCHACRLFAEDFMMYLEANGTVDSKNNNKHQIYIYNEHFAYEAWDDICEQMKTYRVTRIKQFRYVKEPSLLRQVFNEYQKNSKAKQWMYNTPEEDIDDPTGEVRRLKQQCIDLKTKNRLALLEWYEEHQQISLIEWFCKNKFLNNENQDCLTEEKLQPAIKKNVEKLHEEL